MEGSPTRKQSSQDTSPETGSLPRTFAQQALPLRNDTDQQEPREQGSQERSNSRLWTVRVLGVPLNWEIADLENILRPHFPDIAVRSFELEIEGRSRVATATTIFSRDSEASKVIKLSAVGVGSQLRSDHPSWRQPRRTQTLTIDASFLGLTPLYTPGEKHHLFDVVVIHGIGGHPFGSFQARGSTYNWLLDDLPYDLYTEGSQENPAARIILFGYSSTINDDKSVQNLAHLGEAFRTSLRRLARNQTKHIILIGHSFGGLIIKEAFGAIAASTADEDKKLFNAICGFAFFGTPHHGMENKSLLQMAGDQPTRQLVEALNHEGSYIQSTLKEAFGKALGRKGGAEVVCFYETMKSPTARQVNGRWSMSGDPEYLVTQASATSSGWNSGSEFNCSINQTHSEMVKFAPNDPTYDNVRTMLWRMLQNCLKPHSAAGFDSKSAAAYTKSKFSMPKYNRNKDSFLGRQKEINKLLARLHPAAYPDDCKRTALHGLGGIGKTRLAIETVYQARDNWVGEVSVFWVTATDMAAFEASYRKIGSALGIENIDKEPNVKRLVQEALESEDFYWLLVIDNADKRKLVETEESRAESDNQDKGLESYLPNSTRGSILFTTRDGSLARDLCHNSDEDSTMEVKALSPEDSLELLLQGLPQSRRSETKSIDKLLSLLQYLPLAIRQASAYLSKMNHLTIGNYLQSCEGSDGLIRMLANEFKDEHRDGSNGNAVATTWVVSFRQIEKENRHAADALKSVAYLSEKNIPISLLFDEDVSEWDRVTALSVLQSYAFVTTQEGGKLLDVHRLVRIVTQNWIRNQDAGKLLHVRRLVRIVTRNRIWHQNREGQDERQKREAERGEIGRVMRRFNKVAPPGRLSSFSYLSGDDRREMAGFLPHAEVLCELGHDDDYALVRVLDWTGSAYNRAFWRFQDAMLIYERMRDLYKKPTPGWVLHRLADVYRNVGRLNEAESLFWKMWEEDQRLHPQDPDRWTSAQKLANFLIYDCNPKTSEEQKRDRQIQARSILEEVIEDARREPLFHRNRETEHNFLRLREVHATCCSFLEYFEVAASLHEEISQRRRELFKSNHPAVVEGQSHRAMVYFKWGLHEGDHKKLITAHNIQKAAVDEWGKNHDAKSDAYFVVRTAELAEIVYALEHREEALKSLQDVMPSFEKLWNPNDSGVQYYKALLKEWERRAQR